MFRNCMEMPELVQLAQSGFTRSGRPGAKCGECGGDLFRGEPAYSWIGRHGHEIFVCESCFCELFDELDMEEKAALVGSERRIIGETG